MSGQSRTISEPEFRRRLDFMEIDERTRVRLSRLSPLVRQALPQVMANLYEKLGGWQETRELFARADVKRATEWQVQHWMDMAGAQLDMKFPERARKVGDSNLKLGLGAEWYVDGYGVILAELVASMLEANWTKNWTKGLFGRDTSVKDETIQAMVGLIKSALLDLELGLQGYLEGAAPARPEAPSAPQPVGGSRKVVAALTDGFERLSAGDLTFRLDDPFDGDFDELRRDFNEAAARLEDAMTVIRSNSMTIRGGAAAIAVAADDLASRTESQAASLEQTAAALDEITATVRRTSEGAAQADLAAREAKGEAEGSGGVVGEAVAAMSGIEQSARQISQIIGVIDEIAFQTNLLALNAGVEAARAGDAGKGFAVVASEVRALAQRSAEAAKEIKALIGASSNQVGSGVKLVGQTGEALSLMVGKVGEISTLVAEIAASARNQATGLHQVNTSISEMDKVAQRNAAMVDQGASTSHSLVTEADALIRSLERFQLSDAAPIAPRMSAPAVAAPSAGGGARKLQPAREAAVDADEGWEEF